MDALTLKELASLIALTLTDDDVATDYTTRVNLTTNTLQKIGKQITIRGNFPDRLPELDAGDLPLGKTIEEFYQDLPKVISHDRTGASNFTPFDPKFRPAYYSYAIETKDIPLTKRYDEYEEQAIDAESLAKVIANLEFSVEEAVSMYKYGLKRELLGIGASLVDGAMTKSSASGESAEFQVSTEYAEGKFVWKKVSNVDTFGVVVNKIASSNAKTFAELVADGHIVVLDMVKTIAKPIDTATGEAFIEQIKKDAEIAKDATEGNSLNGSAIGAVDGLKLYVLKGIIPNLEVQTEAGAFNGDKLAMPVEVKDLPDFGAVAPSGCYAILTDSRTFALWQAYSSTRLADNGQGDFITWWRHVRYTPFMSRNTFIRIYKNS